MWNEIFSVPVFSESLLCSSDTLGAYFGFLGIHHCAQFIFKEFFSNNGDKNDEQSIRVSALL